VASAFKGNSSASPPPEAGDWASMTEPKGQRPAVGLRSGWGFGGPLARGSLSLTEAAGIAKHRSQIGIRTGTRLHSYELERAAHQSFRLSLASDAYDNPGMISRYSASSYELKLRQIQGLPSKRSKPPSFHEREPRSRSEPAILLLLLFINRHKPKHSNPREEYP
jgi:hypothetical protein